ncbi:MAG: hypothetical protein FJY73_14010 [Candidatus Eisenbacteria bacterium]|nr:hypothetical protein [Candidatus Eisenbacteria bacterium]
MPKRRIASGLACLSVLLLFLLSAGCFETSDKSPKKLRVFYTSDVVGSLEPCG